MSSFPRTFRPTAALAGALVLLALAAGIAASVAGGAFQGRIATLRADSRVLDVALRRDGKIMVVGEVGREAGRLRLMVQRLTAAGRRDRSFNRGRPYLGPIGSVANAVDLARGGKIVVAATLTNRFGLNPQGMLALRLGSNGRPDRSFGGDGRAVALRRRHGEGLAVAVRRSGKVVVAGAATLGANDAFHRVAVAQFRGGGARDRRFGRRGVAVHDFGRFSRAEDLALARRGKIVLAGSVRNNLQSTETLVARLRAGGTLDRSFGGGVKIRQYGAAFSAFRSLVMRGRGRALVAGSAVTSARGPQTLVLALDSRGRRDRSFGGGLVRLSASAHRDQYLESSVPGAFDIDAVRGGFALAGYFDRLGHQRGAVWALRRNGALNRSFGRRGRVLTGFPTRENAIFHALATRGRRLVAGGERTDVLDDPRGVLGRYRVR